MQSTDPHPFIASAAAAGNAAASAAEFDDGEAPPVVSVPLVSPSFGGAVAGRLAGNDLFICYSGPAPFGSQIDELLAGVAFQLQWVRSERIVVETLHFDATFNDLTGVGSDDGDEGGDE
jgi:hypothetical protein